MPLPPRADVGIMIPGSSDYPGLIRVARHLMDKGISSVFFWDEENPKTCPKELDPLFHSLPLQKNLQYTEQTKIFLSNDNAINYLKFFPNSVRFGYNHAYPSNLGRYSSAESFRYYCVHSGIYDYMLLTGVFEPGIRALDIKPFTDQVYPQGYIEKEFGIAPRDTLTFIPTGYLRLMEYSRLAKAKGDTHKDALIFAPGHLHQFATSGGVAIHETILRTLINAFPQLRIVYRPFPTDLDNPEVQQLVEEMLKQTDNFSLDKNKNAVDGYAEYAALVTDHSDIFITFSLATDMPSIRVLPRHNGPAKKSYGYDVSSLEHLIACVRLALREAKEIKKSIRELKEQIIPDISDVELHFAEVIESVLQGTQPSHWISVSTNPRPTPWRYDLKTIAEAVFATINRGISWAGENMIRTALQSRAGDVSLLALNAYMKQHCNRPFHEDLLHVLSLPGGKEELQRFQFSPVKLIELIDQLQKGAEH